jgi:hypothetical protein
MKKLIVTSTIAVALLASSHAALFDYNLIGTAGAGLLFGNEPAVASGGTGGEIGTGIRLDDLGDADPNTNTLKISVGWGSSQGFTDLSSAANNSHIHGPTAANNGSGFTQTAGVLFTLTRSSSLATGGTIIQDITTLTAANVTDLNNGKFYINIHTANNGGGELRGFIVPVPEPTTVSMAALGAMALLGTRRNRRAVAR